MTGILVPFAHNSPPQISGSRLKYSCQSAMSLLYGGIERFYHHPGCRSSDSERMTPHSEVGVWQLEAINPAGAERFHGTFTTKGAFT